MAVLTKQSTCSVKTMNMSENILSAAKYNEKVHVRIADVTVEGIYHANCMKKFFRDVEKAKTENKSVDLAMVWLAQELLDFEVEYVWQESKLFLKTKPLFVELDWQSSLDKNGLRYLGPYVEKQGLKVEDCFIKFKGKWYIHAVALLKILMWKVGNKEKKQKLQEELPCALEALAAKDREFDAGYVPMTNSC